MRYVPSLPFCREFKYNLLKYCWFRIPARNRRRKSNKDLTSVCVMITVGAGCHPRLDHHSRLFDFSGLTHEQASNWPAQQAKLVGRPPTSPANRLLARHTEQSAQHHPAARTSPTASTALGKWKSSNACSKKTFQLSWTLQYLEQENFRQSSLDLRWS